MKKQSLWMLAAILIVCGTTMVLASCCTKNKNTAATTDSGAEQSEAPDYSDKNNWLRQPEATLQ